MPQDAQYVVQAMSQIIQYILGGSAVLTVYFLVKTSLMSYLQKKLTRSENDNQLLPLETEKSRLEEILQAQEEERLKDEKEYRDSIDPK